MSDEEFAESKFVWRGDELRPITPEEAAKLPPIDPAIIGHATAFALEVLAEMKNGRRARYLRVGDYVALRRDHGRWPTNAVGRIVGRDGDSLRANFGLWPADAIGVQVDALRWLDADIDVI